MSRSATVKAIGLTSLLSGSVPTNRSPRTGFSSVALATTTTSLLCADSRLDGTYLSLHHYGFWNPNMVNLADWASDFAKHIIKSCVSRMVLDEWGAPMTTGLNYTG